MPLDHHEIQRLGAKVGFELNEDAARRMAEDAAPQLEQLAILNEVDTEGIEPLYSPTGFLEQLKRAEPEP